MFRMGKIIKLLFMALIFMMLFRSANIGAQTFKVTVDKPVNGIFTFEPALPSDGALPAGTELAVIPKPNSGYVVDAVYYSVPGRWGQMYTEFTAPPFNITVSRDMHLGVSFIEKSAVDHINVTDDVVCAKPGVKTLKYDVFSPRGAKNLPCK